MIPLIVLLISFAVFRVVGFGAPYFANWHRALRATLGVMFLLTAPAHWAKRRPDLVLQIPFLALPSAAGAALMLVCIFPANIKAARENLTVGGHPVPRVVPRLAIQLVFLAALAAAVWR